MSFSALALLFKSSHQTYDLDYHQTSIRDLRKSEKFILLFTENLLNLVSGGLDYVILPLVSPFCMPMVLFLGFMVLSIT